MSINIIKTNKAPWPNGHYEQGIKAGNLIFTSIQLPSSKQEDKSLKIQDQVRLTLRNLLAIIEQAGGNLHTIVKVTIYTIDIIQWEDINQAFEDFFNDAKPARGILVVDQLHGGFKIAGDAIAQVY